MFAAAGIVTQRTQGRSGNWKLNLYWAASKNQVAAFLHYMQKGIRDSDNT